MSKLTSSPESSVRRGVEPLENRQMFAGVAASEHVFFPNPQAVAQFVAIERAIAIDFGSGFAFVPHFGHGWNGDSNSNNSGSASDSGSSSTVTTPVSTPAARGGEAANMTTTAAANATSRSTLTVAAAPTAVANGTAPASQTTMPDAAPVTVLRTVDTDAAKSAAPSTTTPIVVAVTASTPKIFSDRVVTVRFAENTTPTKSDLPSLLTTPIAEPKANQLAVNTPVHHEANATATEDAQVAAQAVAEKGPEAAPLATIPTGNVFNQPLWQRIAAGSATVVILAANWVLRRKREKLAATGRRQA